MKLLIILWNAMALLLFPFTLPLAIFYFWNRGKELRERLGFIDKPDIKDGKITWFHVASVGEANSIISFIKLYTKSFEDEQLFITAMTTTGLLALSRTFPNIPSSHLPFPLLIPLYVFIRRLKPRRLFLTEGELWPDLLLLCKSLGIEVIMLNAQISVRSAKRYKKMGFAQKATWMMVDFFFAQSKTEAESLKQMGIEDKHIAITGNTKADNITLPMTDLFYLKSNDDLILVLGSIRPEEEDAFARIVSQAQKQVLGLKVVWVPRYPDRLTDLIKTMMKYGLSEPILYSRVELKTLPHLLIVNTYGVLIDFYAIADIVLLGGTFSTGGHNPLEATILGKPVILGPTIHKIKSIAETLKENDAIMIAENEFEVTKDIIRLSEIKTLREEMGIRAKQVSEKLKGASERIISILKERKDILP